MVYFNAIYYLVAFFAAAAVTYFATPVVAGLASKHGLFLDLPGKRRIHTKPIPRCGGIAVFLGFNTACVAVLAFPGFHLLGGVLNETWWPHFLIPSLGLLLLGLIDDAVDLKWWVKLLGQCAAVTWLFQGGLSFDSALAIQFPVWLSFIATLVWFLAIINAFNLIDGMDGLAAGLALIGAMGLAVFSILGRHPSDTVVLVGFMGACLAFLSFNFYPARVFLGDSGSMFLGFTLAAAALETGNKTTMVTSLITPLLAMGVPVFDTFLAVWRRSVRSFAAGLRGAPLVGRVASGDLDHLHHRLIKSGLTQRKVAWILYGVSTALAGVGVLSTVFNAHSTGILFLAFVAGAYVVVRHIASVELWDSGRLIVEGFKRPSHPVVATVLYPAMDFAILTLALLAMLLLVEPAEVENGLKLPFLTRLPLWCGVPFIALVFSGTYSRVWSRARAADFVFLALSLVGSTAVVAGFSALRYDADHQSLAVQAIVFLTLAGGLIVGLRAMPRTVRDLVALSQGRGQAQKPYERVLIYGAGVRCRLFVKAYSSPNALASTDTTPLIIGLVDDDINLRKRYVHGYRVLGKGLEIPALVDEHQVDKIIIACDLSDEDRERLEDYCRQRGIGLSAWQSTEKPLVAMEENRRLRKAVEKVVYDLTAEEPPWPPRSGAASPDAKKPAH